MACCHGIIQEYQAMHRRGDPGRTGGIAWRIERFFRRYRVPSLDSLCFMAPKLTNASQRDFFFGGGNGQDYKVGATVGFRSLEKHVFCSPKINGFHWGYDSPRNKVHLFHPTYNWWLWAHLVESASNSGLMGGM